MAKASNKTASSSETDAGRAEVQENVDNETEQGYRGTVADTTPNENYTVDGVTSDKPTPETDPKQAEKVRAAQRDLGTTPAERGESE